MIDILAGIHFVFIRQAQTGFLIFATCALPPIGRLDCVISLSTPITVMPTYLICCYSFSRDNGPLAVDMEAR
jgi:hypothetical protein